MESIRLKRERNESESAVVRPEPKSHLQKLLETPFYMLSERDKRYIKEHSSEYFEPSPITPYYSISRTIEERNKPENSSKGSIWGTEAEILY